MAIAPVLGDSLAEVGDEVGIQLVERDDLKERWVQCFSYFESGKEYWEYYYSLSDLYIEVYAGRMQLWLVGDTKGHFGCFLTELRDYPKARVFRFLFAGSNVEDGINKLSAGETYHEYMMLWARKQGATHSEIFGRVGWKKVGERLGYEHLRICMRKDLSKVWSH